jgi:opacity protein-like surface antigen
MDCMKRAAIVCLLTIGLGGGAHAGGDDWNLVDTGFAPKAPTYWSWSGVYVGAQGGYSFANANFARSTRSMVQYILRESILEAPVSGWATLPSRDGSDTNYGGFIGFNQQWEDIVYGLEANYSSSSLSMSSSDSIGPLLVPGGPNVPAGHDYTYSVTVTSSASVAITDILTLRARAGWATGRFLTYGFFGGAVGRVNVRRFASVNALLIDTNTTTQTSVISPVFLPSNPQHESKSGLFTFGFSAGLGVDVALLESVFLRAEWEYVQFPNIKGINVSINSARAGLGVKF